MRPEDFHTLEVKALFFFEALGICYPVTLCYFTGEWNSQPRLNEELRIRRSFFFFVSERF
jgi:hypothetical protein